jgi:hypothetical protein
MGNIVDSDLSVVGIEGLGICGCDCLDSVHCCSISGSAICFG